MNKSLLAVVCMCVFTGLNAQKITGESIKKHISFLASDKLKGRGTSSKEEKIAAVYIADQYKKAGLVALNGGYLKPFTYKKSTNPHDTGTANAPIKTGHNVVGFLDNKAPYTIVIGAHYDHLGLGHDHTSLDANPEGKIHNGADDNASGTAGVIELAKYYSSNKITEPYNFLFLCFSGEELGLIGSKKWCDKPDMSLDKINYMINMDMIGRLNDSTRKIVVYGVGTAPNFVPLIDSLKSDLSIKKDSAGIGPSDQTSFYLKDIPVLHFFTGQHSDYHKPSDDVEKINIKGEEDVLNYIVQIIDHTLKYPKLTFQKTRTPDNGKVSFKVTLGVMPDYTFEGPGMRIDGVTDGKPASKAGIEKGDVVIKVDDKEVKDVMSYMKVLANYKKGDAAKVTVKRGDKELVKDVVF
jgi:Zn-dependent M28 family amino/carboxypeptidase